MTGEIDVLLVDGFGHPSIHAIPDDPVPPITIKYWHSPRPSGRPVMVQFDRDLDALDPDGRTIYRQRGKGTPDVRWDYLKLTPIVKPATLRLEPPKEPTCNGD